MFNNRGKDEENVVYIPNGFFSSIAKNEVMLLVGKQMQLEIIILSKLSQSQKDKYMFSYNGAFSTVGLLL